MVKFIKNRGKKYFKKLFKMVNFIKNREKEYFKKLFKKRFKVTPDISSEKDSPEFFGALIDEIEKNIKLRLKKVMSH